MTSTDNPRAGGARLVWLGAAVAALGIAAYAAQLRLGRLAIPWYLPALTLAGAGLAAAGFGRRRTLGRGVVAAGLLLLGGFETAALLSLRLPAYDGPVAVGRPFPEFRARRADGRPFERASLAGDRRTALVFFRGRW